MSITKRTLLATAAAGAAVGLSAGAIARAQTSSQSKSTRVAKIDEGEAIKVFPKTGSVHKSNIKVSAEKHEAALKEGRQGNQQKTQ